MAAATSKRYQDTINRHGAYIPSRSITRKPRRSSFYPWSDRPESHVLNAYFAIAIPSVVLLGIVAACLGGR